MGKSFDSFELATKVGVEVVRNRFRVQAINQLLIEKEVYTEEEASAKLAALSYDEEKILAYVKDLLDLTDENLQEEDTEE